MIFAMGISYSLIIIFYCKYFRSEEVEEKLEKIGGRQIYNEVADEVISLSIM